MLYMDLIKRPWGASKMKGFWWVVLPYFSNSLLYEYSEWHERHGYIHVYHKHFLMLVLMLWCVSYMCIWHAQTPCMTARHKFTPQ